MAHQILMLGGRRSGKSSILASIVYALGQNSELFSITDQTDYTMKDGLGISLNAKRIEIDNYLKNRRNAGHNSHFLVDMTPNKGESTYNLETQIKGASKVRFDFVDVQGESMEVTSQYHNRVKELVGQSDVFVVAIDTPYLMQDINENINTVWNRTEEITNLLANIKIENEDVDRKLIILCPVKCEKWTQSGQAEKVTERVCQAYKRMINNWVNHSAVDIWVMPIETAGGIVHSKLLDGYRLFRGKNDRTGELCSKNEITGQIMLKNGEILVPTPDTIIETEPDKSLMYDFTQIPLSWYVVNGKGFAPARCEQPAFHIFRFLVKKEEKAVLIEKQAVDTAPWWKRWWKKLWSPPFGRYLAAYSKLINDLEDRHLIKTSGDGFKKIESVI
ncbi:MAG: hypothetical protein II817_01355 [Bacteroidales bacterium]|nr:hypothetical protein [Bacteroidales bacterium]